MLPTLVTLHDRYAINECYHVLNHLYTVDYGQLKVAERIFRPCLGELRLRSMENPDLKKHGSMDQIHEFHETIQEVL
jgi:hypothetical protein